MLLVGKILKITNMKCSECDKDNKKDSEFCRFCGTKLKAEKEEHKKKDDNKSTKKRKVPTWVIGVLIGLFILFLIGLYISNNSGSQLFISTNNEPKCSDVQVPYETQEEYQKTEYYTETVPYTDRVCESKNLVYSITDFSVDGGCITYNERCIDYILGICSEKIKYCVNKEITCSLNLNNLDNENGQWGIEFLLYQGNSLSNTQIITPSLYPQTNQRVSYTFSLIGEEQADKTYSCSYRVSNTPTKQVCRDVIKYKDVQKSRQVTAYKPVTNYRTETKCN